MKTCPTCQGSYPNNFAVCPQDGSALLEIGTWSEGSVIRGKYRLVAKVGQGGMGAVYKALHLAFDELRALKVIAPELMTDELFVKRFKHEAVITRKLQHPNAVRVDDIDEAEDGRPFIVMEFIEGKSLKQIIREEGALPWQRVCTLIKQAAAALEAAHKLGMVHRDIKPENISLVESPEGESVKVLDFGIAKVKEARMGEGQGLTLTGTGVVIGTPQYMSPEQAMGKRGDELDGRADLYSLGIVMYQMLTADLPFKADTTMEMLLAHMQKPPNPIWVVHPELGVPQPVAVLTMRLLEKNRDLRPASARALIQDIEKAERECNTFGRTRVLSTEDLEKIDVDRSHPVYDQGGGGVAPPRPQPPIRPPETPKVTPQPVVRPQPEPQPQPQPYVPPRKPQESRWGMWVAMAVLLVGVGGGGLYIATRPSGGGSTPITASLSAEPTVVEKGKPITLTWRSTGATELDLEPGVGKVEPEGAKSVTPQDSTTYTLTATGSGGSPQNFFARVTVTAPDVPVEPPPVQPSGHEEPTVIPEKQPKHTYKPPPPHPPRTVDHAKVQAKITEGDVFLRRFEYDDAIRAYEEALALDPSNSSLREKLEKTKHARETERKLGTY